MAKNVNNALWRAWCGIEREVAALLLERAFGQVGLELVSDWCADELIDLCPARRCLRVAPEDGARIDAIMQPSSLGIGSGEVDVAVLPHTLEFADSPQAVLREVDRVLAGEGRLLITGFNPWSAWYLLRYLQGVPVRRAKLLTAARLCDWLQLLGFEIVTVRRFFHRPPLNFPALLDRFEPMENWRYPPLPGCGYAILARKHVYGMTPIRMKRRWETDKVGGIARPAMRTEK